MCWHVHTQHSAQIESLLTGNDKIKSGRKKGERTTEGGEIIFEQLEVGGRDRGGDEREKWQGTKRNEQ